MGKLYTSTVLFRNVTATSRMIRILPPETKYFCVSLIKYPGDDGVIAPGMACHVNIQFSPDSLSDYDDVFVIISDINRFEVPIRAFRPPPELSIPLTLDAGCCLVGNKGETKIHCKNSGGAGRFRMLPPEAWPHPPATAYEYEKIYIPPFVISPAEFSLKNGESIDLIINYNPTNEGKHSQEFVMVCDNCQVQRFTVVGVSCKVAMQICKVDSVVVDFSNPIAAPPEALLFPSRVPGTTSTKTFQVQNVTPLGLNFRWENQNGIYDDVNNLHKAYTISPISGKISASGKMEFEVKFHPYDSIEYTDNLRLVVEKIPRDSAPYPKLLPKVKEKRKTIKNHHGGGHGGGAAAEERREHEVSLVDAPVLFCQLVGGGKCLDITMSPPISIIPGVTYPSKMYSSYVTVRNDDDVEAEYNWQKPYDSSLEPVGDLDNKCQIVITPSSGKIQPKSSIHVKVDFSPTTVGTPRAVHD